MKKLTFFTILLIAFCAVSFTTIQEGKIKKVGDNLYAIPEGMSFTINEQRELQNIFEKHYDLRDLKSKKVKSLEVSYIKGASGPNWFSETRITPTFVSTHVINYNNVEKLRAANFSALEKILEKYSN